MSVTETPFHHGSHQDLLSSPARPAPAGPAPGGPGIDAIIVPTARRPVYIAEASALAEALGCTLVTLHSGKWTTAGMLAERMPPEIDLVAIDIRESDLLRLPDWETSALLAGTVFATRTDLSAKRNLALVLSHMLGWERILFLDDDITALNPHDVRRASSLLGSYNAVGLQIGGFPDNSVVCHAYRQAGGRQSSFVGGGALIVEVKATNGYNSFFPDIYNEDWFFLLDGDKRLLPTTTTGRVNQNRYDPFRTPDRARGEELGDVLAEGIYWLLDQGQSIQDTDSWHWDDFIAKRRQFITKVLAMLAEHELPPAEKTRRVEALKGSLGRLALIKPDLCESYLRAWTRDRQAWRRHLEQLPIDVGRVQALGELTRPGSPGLTWHFGQRADAARRPSGPLSWALEDLAGHGYLDLRELQKPRDPSDDREKVLQLSGRRPVVTGSARQR